MGPGEISLPGYSSKISEELRKKGRKKVSYRHDSSQKNNTICSEQEKEVIGV